MNPRLQSINNRRSTACIALHRGRVSRTARLLRRSHDVARDPESEPPRRIPSRRFDLPLKLQANKGPQCDFKGVDHPICFVPRPPSGDRHPQRSDLNDRLHAASRADALDHPALDQYFDHVGTIRFDQTLVDLGIMVHARAGCAVPPERWRQIRMRRPGAEKSSERCVSDRGLRPHHVQRAAQRGHPEGGYSQFAAQHARRAAVVMTPRGQQRVRIAGQPAEFAGNRLEAQSRGQARIAMCIQLLGPMESTCPGTSGSKTGAGRLVVRPGLSLARTARAMPRSWSIRSFIAPMRS